MKKKKAKVLSGIALAFLACAAFSVPSFSAKAEEGGVRTVESYFSADENVTFLTDVDTPAYVAEKRNGVLVTSQEGGVFTYDNLIEAEDLTKERLLFEMQVTPQTAGEYELNQIIVRLEDAEDSRTYVNISLYNYLYGGANLHGVLAQLTVKTNTVETYRSLKYNNSFNEEKQSDLVNSSLKTGFNQGSEIYAPMAGNKGGHSETLRLYYDNAENALYTVNDNVYAPPTEADPKGQRKVLKEQGVADEEGRFLVVDLDNHNHMGMLKSNLFTGFPSGKIKLSVITNSLVKESASYTVLAIDGQTFDGKYLNDTTAPELSVDLLGYDKAALPHAEVGKEYPVFNARSVDKMYGELGVSYTVLHGDGVLYCTKDGFVPNEAGEYTIRYETSDGGGNKTVEELRVQAVENEPIVGELLVSGKEYDFGDESKKNAKGNYETPLYYPVKVPTMTATGGAGGVSVETVVSYAGKKVELERGEFTPDKKGVYEVAYILRDYLGNTAVYEYRLETVYSDLPMLHEPNLSSYLAIGQATRFPKVNAELYTPWGQTMTPYTSICVYKADGETLLAKFVGSEEAVYTPSESDGDSVIVVYLAAKDENASGIYYAKEISLVSSNQLSSKFVKSEGVSMEMGREGDSFDFFFTGENQSVEFISKMSISGGLLIEFNVPKDMNAYGGVAVTVVDANDPNNYIVVKFYKNPDEKAKTSAVTVNDGAAGEFPASFHGNVSDYFVFTVSEKGEIYNFNEDVVAKAENFKGFTGGYVYVSMSAFDVAATEETPAAISWVSVKNQNFNEVSEYKDLIAPTLSISAKPVGRAKLGEKLYVSGATASDVYAEQVSITVTVTFDDKEILKAEDAFGQFGGAWFTVTDYGIYTITYQAVDLQGLKTTRSYVVEVVDMTAPTICIEGDMPTEGVVGEKLELPKAVAVDNKDVGLKVYVVVIDPMNVYTVYEQGETYIFPYAGRYLVKYYVEDLQCNTAYSEEYVVNVK